MKFLFQGDSITDACRIREDDGNYGFGYPNLFASDFLKNQKGVFEFVNRAVSGDRIVDIYARIKRDLINLKPDYMSILVGVNDVWHEIGDNNGVDAEKYEKVYNMLIEEVKQALPNIKIFILEPFVLLGEGTKERYDYFRAEVLKRAVAAKRVAEKNNLVFIPLQAQFDELSSDGNTSYWLADGVHPAPAGHQLIKEALKEAVLKTL